jgi:hypothetical protein
MLRAAHRATDAPGVAVCAELAADVPAGVAGPAAGTPLSLTRAGMTCGTGQRELRVRSKLSGTP